MIKIVQKHIRPGRQSRPATNPRSSLYGKTRAPEYVTIHNAWSPGMNALALNNYMDTDAAAARPASWHYSVDEKKAVEGVPIREVAWHAGDGLHGTGNRKSIGIEICDYAILYRDSNGDIRAYGEGHPTYPKYLEAEENAARLTAHLIRTVPSLKPFPECVVQHTRWRAASGCPSHIRNRKGGWEDFLNKVKKYLDKEPDQPPKNAIVYRVIAGSYSRPENAEAQAEKIDRATPSMVPFIVYNKVNGNFYYRVVAVETDRMDHATAAREWLKDRKLGNAFIITARADGRGDLPYPEPEENPPEEEPEKPEPDPGPPDQDETGGIPEGLMALLKQLYLELKKLFG